jgi:hypothetical protein
MRIFKTTIIFLAFVTCSFAQTDTKTTIIENYLKVNYVSDIYYHMWDTTKILIRNPVFYYSEETIPINLNRFHKQFPYPFDKKKKLNVSQILHFKNSPDVKNYISNESETGQLKLQTKTEEKNYIVFNSGLVEGKYVMVEVFFKRIDQLLHKGDTEYKRYRPMNGGISYLFVFNDSGCLVEIYKEPFVYD